MESIENNWHVEYFPYTQPSHQPRIPTVQKKNVNQNKKYILRCQFGKSWEKMSSTETYHIHKFKSHKMINEVSVVSFPSSSIQTVTTFLSDLCFPLQEMSIRRKYLLCGRRSRAAIKFNFICHSPCLLLSLFKFSSSVFYLFHRIEISHKIQNKFTLIIHNLSSFRKHRRTRDLVLLLARLGKAKLICYSVLLGCQNKFPKLTIKFWNLLLIEGDNIKKFMFVLNFYVFWYMGCCSFFLRNMDSGLVA